MCVLPNYCNLFVCRLNVNITCEYIFVYVPVIPMYLSFQKIESINIYIQSCHSIKALYEKYDIKLFIKKILLFKHVLKYPLKPTK